MAEAAEGLELSGDASLKKILNNTIATIEDNKSQLFDIYESVRTEVEAAKKQLEDLKFQVRQTIERVDALEKQEQQEKQKLALASKNFAQEEDSEARMKERYDAVKNVQVALAVVLVVGEVDLLQPRPVYGAKAHGARLARGVYLAIAQVEGAKLTGGVPYGRHLGVGGGVVVGCDAVHARSHHLSVACYHGAERSAAVAHVVYREGDGSLHEVFVCHGFNVSECLGVNAFHVFLQLRC